MVVTHSSSGERTFKRDTDESRIMAQGQGLDERWDAAAADKRGHAARRSIRGYVCHRPDRLLHDIMAVRDRRLDDIMYKAACHCADDQDKRE